MVAGQPFISCRTKNILYAYQACVVHRNALKPVSMPHYPKIQSTARSSAAATCRVDTFHFNSRVQGEKHNAGAPVRGRPGAKGGRPETAGSSAASRAAQRRARAFPPWCVLGRRSARTGAARCAGSTSSPSTRAMPCAPLSLLAVPPVSIQQHSSSSHGISGVSKHFKQSTNVINSRVVHLRLSSGAQMTMVHDLRCSSS